MSTSADFDRVYRHGRSQANRHLVVYAFPRDGGGEARMGLSVSRKVGGAVDRNLIKRLLREAFETVALDGAGVDLVVVARPPARELAEREGLAGIKEALEDLVGRVVPSGRGGASTPKAAT